MKGPQMTNQEAFLAKDGEQNPDGPERFDADTAWDHYQRDPNRWTHPVDADGLDPVGQMVCTDGPWWRAPDGPGR